MGKPKQKSKDKKNSKSQRGDSSYEESQAHSEQQSDEDIQSLSGEQVQDQQSEESSPVEAAIKTMTFRARRGAKMKDLIKGKIDKDEFWDKNNIYFGGDLRGKDEDQHESDYQASSSGRDQFDSDFDLTDSYPGKRGRKKGQKVKKKIVRNETSRPRGRPRVIKQESTPAVKQESSESIAEQKKEKKKRIYKQIPIKNNDAFIIYKAITYKKKSTKVTKESSKEQEKEMSLEQQAAV